MVVSDRQLTVQGDVGLACQHVGGKAVRMLVWGDELAKDGEMGGLTFKRCQRERSVCRTLRERSRAGSVRAQCPVTDPWALEPERLKPPLGIGGVFGM